MSIRPQYSERIFEGSKLFELRRSRVRAETGDIVWVYESAPTMALVGAFVVGRVLFDSTDTLWRTHGLAFGVSAGEYEMYFSDRKFGCAIEIAEAIRVSAIPLRTLRDRVQGFRPPQSYQWCGPDLGRVLPRRAFNRQLDAGVAANRSLAPRFSV